MKTWNNEWRVYAPLRTAFRWFMWCVPLAFGAHVIVAVLRRAMEGS